MMNPLFFNASCVKHAFLATSQVKHFTLLGATLFQGPVDLPPATLNSLLYTLLTVKIPSLWCLQMSLSESGRLHKPTADCATASPQDVTASPAN